MRPTWTSPRSGLPPELMAEELLASSPAAMLRQLTGAQAVSWSTSSSSRSMTTPPGWRRMTSRCNGFLLRALQMRNAAGRFAAIRAGYAGLSPGDDYAAETAAWEL